MSSSIKKFMLERAKDLSNVEEIRGKVPDECVISIKYKDGSFHHLLPYSLDPAEFVEDLVLTEDIPLDLLDKKEKTETLREQKPLILKNRQAFGDILMFTCMHYASPIFLSNGDKKLIGTIVNAKEELSVKSFNFETKKIEDKKITGWIKNNHKSKEWYYLSFEGAALVNNGPEVLAGVFLTGDHEVFTKRGKVRVDSLDFAEKILVDERIPNKRQKEVFFGSLLGDSSLGKTNGSFTQTRGIFSFGHCKAQEEWALLKAKCFEDFRFDFSERESNGNRQNRVGGYTHSNPFFGIQRRLWYREINGIEKKIVPDFLSKENFSTLALVTWYLDDGTFQKSRESGATFCSESFTEEENEKLAKIIMERFNIKARVISGDKNEKTYYRIYIGNGHDKSGDSDEFFKLIAPYVPLSMRFKIPNKFKDIPFNASLWDLGDSLPYYAESIVEKKSPSSNYQLDKSYCISVEDNENFIVNKMVVSNCAVRDMKRVFPKWPINVASTAMHIWDNNPYLDRSLTPENAEVLEIGPSYLTNASNRDDRHFANAFRISIEQKLGIQIPQGLIKPDIWMTQEEIDTPPIVNPPYWIILAGEKGDWTAKTYPFNRWQEFVEKFENMTFVQIGGSEHKHPLLKGPNIINFIGKTQDRNTGIRDLFKLFYRAEGSIGLVSFQMHLAAAFGMPCIVIAGAREPARFTRYPGHQYLCTDGCLPCAEEKACWHCNLEKTCPNIEEGTDGRKYPKCVEIIHTEDLERAFIQFYDGGRLSWEKTRKLTLPNPPVMETIIHAIAKPVSSEKEEGVAVDFSPEKYGFAWGGSSITKADWIFIKPILEKYEVETILEFGAGLSTLLFASLGIRVISFELDKDAKGSWSDMISRNNPNIDIRIWDGKDLQGPLPHFDLVFVDGPSGSQNRERSIQLSSEMADLIIVHDGGRKLESKWQAEYIAPKFAYTENGGTRSAFWAKTKPEEEAEPQIVFSPERLVKMVFNGRGEGGAESSTTWLMNNFVALGYDVEYIHTHEKPSGTFRKQGNPKIVTTNDLDALTGPCELLILYTNDWVWDFNKEPLVDKFQLIHAKRKVMIINYRLGKIGKIPWTQGWDKYLFLNSSLEQAFMESITEAVGSSWKGLTNSLSPPTLLNSFFGSQIDYSGRLRLIRHGSQGDSKYPKDFNHIVKTILEEIPGCEIHLMPPPTFLADFGERVKSYKRNQPPVWEFLEKGNCFWYALPPGYTDMGPKVIMEAQAAGLPIIADNHSGPKDRVVSKTGILCEDLDDYIDAMKLFDNENIRKETGIRARDHAMKEYDPERWIKEIIGNE